MKRFYKTVSVGERENGYGVDLDGRPVRTPEGAALCVPHRKLAEALVWEWNAQEKEIIPDDMPLTQIVCTAQDQISRDREAMTKKLQDWLDTDLLCYREHDSVHMAQRQAASRDRWLNWF